MLSAALTSYAKQAEDDELEKMTLFIKGKPPGRLRRPRECCREHDGHSPEELMAALMVGEFIAHDSKLPVREFKSQSCGQLQRAYRLSPFP
jgi:hypothetical protein